MDGSKRKIIFDKPSLINIAVDLVLSLFVGFAISIIIFLGFYSHLGAGDLREIVGLYFALIFINSPYSMLFRLVVLVPIYVPVFSILMTRGLVQKVSSRKGWIFPAFVVALISVVVAVTVTIVGSLLMGYGGIGMVGLVLLVGLLFIIFGFLIGIFLGLLFAPLRQIYKIIVALITSALVGGGLKLLF